VVWCEGGGGGGDGVGGGKAVLLPFLHTPSTAAELRDGGKFQH